MTKHTETVTAEPLVTDAVVTGKRTRPFWWGIDLPAPISSTVRWACCNGSCYTKREKKVSPLAENVPDYAPAKYPAVNHGPI